MGKDLCSLYKRECIEGLCSATPHPEDCQYRRVDEPVRLIDELKEELAEIIKI